MNFLHVFPKYYTRFLLITALISMMLFSVAGFNKKYNNTLKECNEISSHESITLKVASFPIIKNGKLSFEGIVKGHGMPEAKFNISIKDEKNTKLYPGDTIVIEEFTLFSPEKPGNEGGFDSATYSKSQNIYGTLYTKSAPELVSKEINFVLRMLTNIRQNVIGSIDKFFKSEYAGLVKALITGERYGIDDTTEDSLKVSGVYHIVAISGLHLNIFIMFISKFISAMKVKRKKKALISGIICSVTSIFVLVFTGFGLSVIRAFVMLLISLGSGILARKYSGKNALMLAAAIIIIIAPSSIYSTGFILSLLSTFAVLISSDVIKRLKERDGTPTILYGNIASVFITSALCALFTLPVTMGTFYFLPTYSAFANLVILPAVSPALIASVIFCICSAIGADWLARLVSWFVTALVHYISNATKLISSVPFAKINLYPLYTFEILILLVCICAGVYFIARKMKKSAMASAVIFVVAVCACLVYNNTDKDVKLIFADVGQGDCTILKLPDGQGVMIDCGSADNEEYIGDEIRNTLIKNNITKLSAVFVSHYHEDHVSELTNLANDGIINNIFIPSLYSIGNEEAIQNRKKLIAASLKSGVKIHEMKKGNTIEPAKDCLFEVLLPGTDMFMDDNNMSCVIKFTYGDTVTLFTGDIEAEATQRLLDENIDCDILKVPHHGAKNKLIKQILEKSTPDYALIGCGENNVYKHPAKETEDALKECGAKIYRTDKDGAVTLTFDKTEIKDVAKMR